MHLPAEHAIGQGRGNTSAAVALCAVSALALGVRLWALDAESLFMDELYQVGMYGLPASYVVTQATQQCQPPLGYLIGAGLHRLGLSESDWWVRFPAVLFGVGGVFLLGWWVRRMAGTAAGVAAAVLLAVCPFHVAMSQEARPYAIFLFFAQAGVLTFAYARRRHTLWAWGCFTVVFTALLMTRWVGPQYITLGLAAYTLGAWLVSRPGGDEQCRRTETGKLWAAFTAGAVAYAVNNPILGLIMVRYRALRGAGPAEYGTPWLDRTWDQLSDAYTAVLSGYTPVTMSGVQGPVWPLALGGTLAVIGLGLLMVSARRKPGAHATLFICTMVPFPLLYALVYSRLNGHPKPQYLLLMAVPLLGCIAIAVDALARLARRVGPSASGLVLLAGIGAVAVPMGRATVRGLGTPEKRDWRGLLAYLDGLAQPGDALACATPDFVPPAYRSPVYGLGRYFEAPSDVLQIRIDTPLEVLDEPPWVTSGNTVWIVCYKDRFYQGRDLLPAPADPPPRVSVHDFTGLFLMELPGDTPAADRLMQGLAALNRDLPQRSALVAPNVYRGRYFHARGRDAEAQACFEAARRQCRNDAELLTLNRKYLPDKQRCQEGFSGTGKSS